MKNTVRICVVAALALGAAACAKNNAPATLPPEPATVAGNPGVPQAPAGIVPGSNADFLAQLQGRNVIYFGTDKYDVDNDDIAALRAQAEWLQRYPNKRATIEGHTDERGTRDYNLALGERRGNAAKNYLVSLGVSAARLTVVSYGKERPAALGSTEQAWAQNRRAATITID